MLDTYKKLWKLLDKKERRNAILLLALMMLMGLSEVFGVASVLPFISVLLNPSVVNENGILSWVYKFFEFPDLNSFFVFLGLIVFFVVIINLIIKAFTNWAMARFSHMRSYSIGSRLLNNYLHRPYDWFLQQHSSDLGKSVLSEVQEVVTQSLMPSVQLIGNVIVALFLVILLIIVDPIVALVALVLFGGAYALIYVVLRKYLAKLGAERLSSNRQRYQVAQEALAGIKEVKVFGTENEYVSEFNHYAEKFSKCIASNQVIGQLPRFFLEGIAFGSMLLIILFNIDNDALNSVLPIVTLYAFAGYRLMPALQQIYQALTKIRFSKCVLNTVYKDSLVKISILDEFALDALKPLSVKHDIVFSNVTFAYPGSAVPALENFDLNIPARSTVALIGSTGAGKTTAVDLLLGLLAPDGGDIRIDGRPLAENTLIQWKKTIGYVPQNIFLFDDSIAKNIAFGVAEQDIDMSAVERAARTAELHDFVLSKLPEGYDTVVGERGVRLSGGQLQRIGIARALYHDPDVLILDEATSALDNLTEKAVMDAVHNLSHKKTIIMIAHRISSVKQCDVLFLLDNGKVAAQGDYDTLLAECDKFKAIVNR